MGDHGGAPPPHNSLKTAAVTGGSRCSRSEDFSLIAGRRRKMSRPGDLATGTCDRVSFAPTAVTTPHPSQPGHLATS